MAGGRFEARSKFSHFAPTIADKWLESWKVSKQKRFSEAFVVDVCVRLELWIVWP